MLGRLGGQSSVADARAALHPWKIEGAQLTVLILILGLGAYVLYPLALILINSFNIARIGQAPVYGLDAWADAWRTPGISQALVNTLTVGFWYQMISFPIGVLVAWVLARTNVPWARGLEFLFWVSFFIPALSTTLGWILLMDPRAGVLNQIANAVGFGTGHFNVYSVPGIIWVHLVSHAISLKVMLLTPAFRNMDAALEEAGRMSGGNSWNTLWNVTLPAMTPALVVVFMFGIVRLFESFEIELLLGVPFDFYVFSTKIVDLVRQEPPRAAQATALGSVTLLLLAIAAPVQRWLTTRREYRTLTDRMKPGVIELGRLRWPVFAIVGSLAALVSIVPILSVLAGSLMVRFGFFGLAQPWTLQHWQRSLADSVFTRSLGNTLVLAFLAALVGTLLFSIVAYAIVRLRSVHGRGLLDILVWVPSVIPGVLAGLGLLWMFVGVPVFQPLYGTIFVLMIAVIMGGVTLSTQTLKASFLQLGPELEEASRMSGANWVRTYLRVVLPLLAPTLVVVATLKFLFAANATSSIVLLATSETRPLSLLTLDFVHEGLRESAAVVTTIITVLTTGVALLARALGFNMSVRS